MDVELRSPRTIQAVTAGAVLLGFVADVRVVPLLAVVALLATFVRVEPTYRITWATEVGLLLVATLLFFAGRGGWGWIFASVAAGIAALAAAANVWILPDGLSDG
jgi:hypothetical protein